MLSRIRITAALLVVMALAVFAVPRATNDHPPVVAHTVSVVSVPSHVPAPAPLPFDMIAFSAVAGATALSKKNKNLIVDSIIHVTRKGEDGKAVTQVIKPGTLVDDTDLTDEEIDEHVARKSVRYATTAELEKLERVASERATAKALQDADAENAALDAAAESERQQIIADAEAEKAKKIAKLEERLAKDRQEAAEKAADEAKKAASAPKKGGAAKSTATPPPTNTPDAKAQAAGGTSTPAEGIAPTTPS